MRLDFTSKCYNLIFIETPLEDFIDKKHELVRLSERIDRDRLENICKILCRDRSQRSKY